MTIKEFEIQYALGSLTDEVKEELAANYNTPKEILIKLSKDKDWYIRMTVASNRNTPKKVIIKLSFDESWNVRYSALSRLNFKFELVN